MPTAATLLAEAATEPTMARLGVAAPLLLVVMGIGASLLPFVPAVHIEPEWTEIASWNTQENIGTHNRIEVTGVRPDGEGIIVSVQVRGDGYNGGGTFAIHSRGGTIHRMVIRG